MDDTHATQPKCGGLLEATACKGYHHGSNLIKQIIPHSTTVVGVRVVHVAIYEAKDQSECVHLCRTVLALRPKTAF